VPIDDFPEIAVVLGGGIAADGTPTASTLARARAVGHLARRRPAAAVIASGSHGDGPPPPRSEAIVLADAIAAAGIPRERIFLEERSRETIGNAVEVAVQYLGGIEPRPLYLVTSPFHLERALVVFRSVLGFAWQVQAVSAEETDDDLAHANAETRFLQETFDFFKGTTPGDITAIERRYRARAIERGYGEAQGAAEKKR
jgi:uncharacterized SAM-binding protein YcdF (DUF218 family)